MRKAGFKFDSHGKNHDWYVRGKDREQIPRHTRMDDRVAKDIMDTAFTVDELKNHEFLKKNKGRAIKNLGVLFNFINLYRES